MKLADLLSTLYADKDFSRGVALTVAGVVGLLTYLWKGDWVISAFSAVIAFPLTRILADAFHTRWNVQKTKERTETELKEKFDRFSPEEKQILKFFVEAGGACVSIGYVNKSKIPFPRPALNSLMARGLVHSSVMEDGMTEAFVLDPDMFDVAQKYLRHDG